MLTFQHAVAELGISPALVADFANAGVLPPHLSGAEPLVSFDLADVARLRDAIFYWTGAVPFARPRERADIAFDAIVERVRVLRLKQAA